MTYKPTEIENVLLQVLGHVDNPANLGTIGQAMFQFIEKQKAKKVDNFTDEERQLIEHMRVLKEAEDQHNLVWLDYKSWNVVNPLFREKFVTLLKPLFWNGVFTRLTDFYIVETEVMSKLDHQVVASLFRKGGNYQIYCVGSDQKDYQLMNKKEFIDLSLSINNNIVRSYAKAGSKLYIKEFKQQNTSGGIDESKTTNSKDDTTSATI